MNNRLIGITGVILLILFAFILIPNRVGATPNCDHYDQHPAENGHGAWGECKTATPVVTTETPRHCNDEHGHDDWYNKHCTAVTETATSDPTDEVTSSPTATEVVTNEPTDTITPISTDEPTITATQASPTPDDPTETPTTITDDPAWIPQTVTPTPTPFIPATITCTRGCVYNLGGKPGTHAVTAVSPVSDGPYYWQIKINDVWYDLYDCYGVIITTTAEARGETSITRLIVDSSEPTDPDSYRVSGGAGAILFDDHTY